MIVSIFLPVGACIFLCVKRKTGKAVLLGALCFLVFQVLMRLPVLQYVLPRAAGYQLLQISHPVLHLFLLAASAGLFEECGRYIMMKLFLKKAGLYDALAFGTAHGATEAALLVGIPSFAALVTGLPQAAPLEMFLAGTERLCAMSAHICWSVLVWRSVKEKKPFQLALAVVLHTVFDFTAGFLSYSGVGLLAVEAVVLLMSAILLLYTVLAVHTIKKRGEYFD